MKKVLLFLALATVLFSCKKKEEEEKMEYETYTGDFIYQADAAVLQGANFVYGVTMDEMATELAERTSKVRQDDFQTVNVTVKGELHPKSADEEGWPEVLTIKEIVNVANTPSEADIKFDSKTAKDSITKTTH